MTFINVKREQLKKIKMILSFINFYTILNLNLFGKKYSKNYKIVAISYGDKNFKKQLKINKLTAIKVGKVDEYYSYTFDDIDLAFLKKNKEILYRPRGNGYWLWKPYFILKTLKEKLNKDDYIVYTDAGIFYLDEVEKIIKFMKSINEEIWLNRLTHLEKIYSKRDAFILLDADSPINSDTFQYMAGIQIYKKSKFTEIFLEKVLNYSTDKRIITDDPNTQGLPNYQGFNENRHDQTIISILFKKYKFSNLNKNKTKVDDLNNMNYNFTSKIFCIYRRLSFKSLYDLRIKCQEKV
jgi:hypothetical protein